MVDNVGPGKGVVIAAGAHVDPVIFSLEADQDAIGQGSGINHDLARLQAMVLGNRLDKRPHLQGLGPLGNGPFQVGDL